MKPAAKTVRIVLPLLAVVLIGWWLLSRLGPQPEFKETFYASGELKSRTEVSGDLLNGLSEGWYTNGQLQVTEYFVDGVSHGLRTKWYITGEKKSEADIVSGQIHGRYRRWFENGQLAEDAAFSNGIPHGLSRAWYEDGERKAEVTMNKGEVVKQQFWDETGSPRQ